MYVMKQAFINLSLIVEHLSFHKLHYFLVGTILIF